MGVCHPQRIENTLLHKLAQRLLGNRLHQITQHVVRVTVQPRRAWLVVQRQPGQRPNRRVAGDLKNLKRLLETSGDSVAT